MRKKKVIPEAEIRKLYCVENKNTYEISEIFGVHRSTVENRLKKLGIESKIKRRNNLVASRKLSEYQKHFIIGSLLGDGHVTGGKRTPRYITSHSIKQEGYVNWVCSIFGDLRGSRKEYSTINKQNGKKYEFINFTTVSIPELTKYREKFYNQDGIKIIPNDIDKIMLDPLSLAVWIMEDGHFNNRNKGTYICTDCFSLDDHLLLKEILLSNFGLCANIIKYKNGFRLRFGSNQAKKIKETICSHMIESMKYKII